MDNRLKVMWGLEGLERGVRVCDKCGLTLQTRVIEIGEIHGLDGGVFRGIGCG